MQLKVLLTGATGMVGQGVLTECLESPSVASVVVIGRRTCGVTHTKLTEIIHKDFLDFSAVENAFKGCNACFWCLGSTSLGTSEADYRRVTVEFTLKAAEPLSRLCPELTFIFVSGAGTRQDGKGSSMWMRVKGEIEMRLNDYHFKQLYVFRPAYIRPLKGVIPSWPILYKLTGPLYPLMKMLMPKYVSTTEQVGLAMINAATKGYEKQILESPDIVKLAGK